MHFSHLVIVIFFFLFLCEMAGAAEQSSFLHHSAISEKRLNVTDSIWCYQSSKKEHSKVG